MRSNSRTSRFLQDAGAGIDAGVVDDDVGRRPFLGDEGGEGGDPALDLQVRHVAGRGLQAQPGRRFIQLVGAEIRQHQRRALAGEGGGDPAAIDTGGAGNSENAFAGEALVGGHGVGFLSGVCGQPIAHPSDAKPGV